ncbi:MAG: enoyl-CoA hydratase/isomerase family protein [Proteobacteria bacterium]|nr:enoyl-CoA hydratase/isomerase family protein [Pseudomonadota bacterium]
MEFKNIILQKSDNIATIKLNRPKTFNSLDGGLLHDLAEVSKICLDDEDIRAVIITGEGKAFCAGGDLSVFKDHLKTDLSALFSQVINDLNAAIMNIRKMPKPVIAAINGAVGGAGMSIAAACDLRICASSAKFRQGYTGVGLTGDGGWSLTVPLLVGFGKASELLLLNPVFDAGQALEWGFVNKVVEDTELEKESLEIAKKLASGPTKTFAIAKANLNHAMLGLLERHLELEGSGMIKAAKTSDSHEGIRAFLEKRSPEFIGE